MQIRAVRPEDGASLYKCLARNQFGSSERLIKLIVLGIPERPSQVRVRDVWSRSALITWQGPLSADANGRISNYTIQYWRKTALGQSLALQNHRREELRVDGLQTSALLAHLSPALTYEVSVIAHNQVGSSEPSETVNVTTSEEEPSAPPTDVQVEPRGSSSLYVLWKAPPSENLNGKLLGFYIGYRTRLATSSHPLLLSSSGQLVLAQSSQQQQQQQQQQQPVQQQQQQQQQQSQSSQQQSAIFSFKTADAVEGQVYYDTFLSNLKHSQEYEVIVRAFNKAGSGPDCHTVLARTNSARLPQAPNLQVQRVNSGSVTLRWSSTVVLGGALGNARLSQAALQHANSEILKFLLYYQVQGERDWYELSVARSPFQQADQGQPEAAVEQQQQSDLSIMGAGKPVVELVDGTNELITSQASVHTLSNLQPGVVYRIYVAAANDYGVGDPSNIVSVRTEPGMQSLAQLQLGPARVVESPASGVSGLLDQLSQQWHGMLYTLLSSLALIAIVVILVAYLVWQRKLKRRYNSSAGCSYPTSWTPAATDTFQSEYSIKRFAPAASQAAHLSAAGVGVPVAPSGCELAYDEGQPSRGAPLAPIDAAPSGRILVRGGTSTRPVLSSHYHQPADLISAGSETLQVPRSNASLRQQQQQLTAKAISTLNRNQNRQLPPIPYSTLSVKEIGSGPGKQQQQQQAHWRQLRQPSPDYRLCNQQQKQACQPASFRTNNKSTGGSQTPLIYGVIE